MRKTLRNTFGSVSTSWRLRAAMRAGCSFIDSSVKRAPPPRISRECPGGRPEMRHHLIGKSMHHLKHLTGALAVAARCQDLVDAKLSIDRQPVDELGAGANEKGSRRVPPAFACAATVQSCRRAQSLGL